MKIKTNLKAGAAFDAFRKGSGNHNETLVRDTAKSKAPRVKTGLRAGAETVHRR